MRENFTIIIFLNVSSILKDRILISANYIINTHESYAKRQQPSLLSLLKPSSDAERGGYSSRPVGNYFTVVLRKKNKTLCRYEGEASGQA